MNRRSLMFVLGMLLLVFLNSVDAYAKSDGLVDEKVESNKIYDSLSDSIRNRWDNGLEQLETTDEIEIKGSFSERIIRSITNTFYKHLVSIKAWSLLIGILSMIIGGFITATAKLNKKLKRFAISFFVITIPILLVIFVFGITKLISMFV